MPIEIITFPLRRQLPDSLETSPDPLALAGEIPLGSPSMVVLRPLFFFSPWRDGGFSPILSACANDSEPPVGFFSLFLAGLALFPEHSLEVAGSS